MSLCLPLLIALASAAPLAAQGPAPTPGLDALAAFDGAWRGPATLSLPSGTKREFVQTERVGPALGGAIRVIEGKSYDATGADAGFNAFGIVSAAEGAGYEFRAYAQGRAGTFSMNIADGSFEWSMPAGPGAVVRYRAVVRRTATGKPVAWHEEGWYEAGGRRVAQVFTMDLTRVGDTDWPAGRPISPR